MRRLPASLVICALAAVALLTACSGNNNKKASPTTPPGVTRAPATTSGSGATGAAAASAGPASAQTVTPQRTPQAGPSAGCTAANQGPQATAAAAAPPTAEPPFNPGPQPTRPAVDLAAFTVNPSYIPAGYKSLDADRKDPVAIGARDIASTANNPQGTLNHLTNTGYLGGRQQGWSADSVQNRIPTIYVLHFVFANDAGASDFLRNPPLSAIICAKPEPGPQIGQETLHLFYTYETPGGAGPADGHSLYWRCGRVVIGVNDSSAPGKASQGVVEDLGRKILADFVKSQPCS